MKHILITSDLSAEALRPFGQVFELAKILGAKITLLHVVQELILAPHGAPLAPAVISPELPKDMEEAREVLGKQAAKLEGDVPIEAVVISSTRIPMAINQYANEHAVDLVALSTHGRSGWRHLILGSVAEEVLRHSEVPVLSFPRKSE